MKAQEQPCPIVINSYQSYGSFSLFGHSRAFNTWYNQGYNKEYKFAPPHKTNQNKKGWKKSLHLT